MRRTLDRAIKAGEGTDIPMRDALTVAHVIDPGILKVKNYFIAVETSGEMTAGETVGYTQAPIFKSAPLKASAITAASPDAPFRPNANVAIGVEPERFFRLFLERLTGRV
ncbi:MAG: hypothetical protein DMG57_19520 [Acidobacteria bacterium]|nr:MAG: hypothetical protein DMG57_19520 [Acidobacteriota bacterium]